MAYVAYKEFNGEYASPKILPARSTLDSPALEEFVVMAFFVPTTDAYRVRQSLAAFSNAGLVRCVPNLPGNQARLDIHLPKSKSQQVMDCLMACVPCGQFGSITCWAKYLAQQASLKQNF